jgi:hypothetical protein
MDVIPSQHEVLWPHSTPLITEGAAPGAAVIAGLNGGGSTSAIAGPGTERGCGTGVGVDADSCSLGAAAGAGPVLFCDIESTLLAEVGPNKTSPSITFSAND